MQPGKICPVHWMSGGHLKAHDVQLSMLALFSGFFNFTLPFTIHINGSRRAVYILQLFIL